MACGQCGMRDLSELKGKKVKLLGTFSTKKRCLEGKKGFVDRVDEKGILYIIVNDSFGTAGPFELTLDDVEIQ